MERPLTKETPRHSDRIKLALSAVEGDRRESNGEEESKDLFKYPRDLCFVLSVVALAKMEARRAK